MEVTSTLFILGSVFAALDLICGIWASSKGGAAFSIRAALAKLFAAAHFLCFGQAVAALSMVVDAFRFGSAFALQDKKIKRLACGFFASGLLGVSWIAWDSIIDLLPLSASLIGTFAVFNLEGLSFRRLMLIPNLLTCSFALLIGSPVLVVAAILNIAMMIRGIRALRLKA